MPLRAKDVRGIRRNVRIFDLRDEQAVVRLLRHLGFPNLARSHPLRSVFGIALESNCRWVVAEPYISTDYSDEFAGCYSRVFRPIPRLCTRLHFFSKSVKHLTFLTLLEMPDVVKVEHYIGYSVIRPIPVFQTGDTVLKSPYCSDDGSDLIHCQAEFEVHLFGEELRVRGMPFIQQETNVGVCAQADLWMVARYMNRLGETRRYRPSELTRLAAPYSTLNSIREGLTDEQMLEALRQMGLNPVMIYPQNASEAREVLYAYAESELPVIVGLPQHVAVVIGHDYAPNMVRHSPPRGEVVTLAAYVNAFFVHDDAEGPYIRRTIGRGEIPVGRSRQEVVTLDGVPVEYCMAIVPPRVLLRPEDVIEMGRIWVARIRKWILALPRVKKETVWPKEDLQNLVFRPYLRRSDRFKTEIMEFARREKVDAAIAVRYCCAPMPKYIWVLELSKVDEVRNRSPHRRLVRGEILLDSTANRHSVDDALLAFHLNGRIYWRSRNEPTREYFFDGPFSSEPRPPLLRPVKREHQAS